MNEINIKDLNKVALKALTYAAYKTIHNAIEKGVNNKIPLRELFNNKQESGNILSDISFLVLRSFNFLNRDKVLREKLHGVFGYEEAINKLKSGIDEIIVETKMNRSSFNPDIKEIMKTDVSKLEIKSEMNLNLDNLTEKQKKEVLTLFFGGELALEIINAEGTEEFKNIIMEPDTGYNTSKMNSELTRYMKIWTKKNLNKKSKLKETYEELLQELKNKSSEIGDDDE